MAKNKPSGGSQRLIRELEDRAGVNLSDCFQCQKCSAGCPLAEQTDLLPHAIIRMAQLGLEQELLESKHIWLCVSCEACSTRCPNKVKVAKAIDALRHIALEQGMEPAESEVAAFHRAVLDTLERHGRLFELGMIARYKLKTGQYTKDATMGIGMLRRGKLRFFASNVKDRDQLEAMFGRENNKE